MISPTYLTRREDGKLTSTRQIAIGTWLCTGCLRALPESNFPPKKRDAEGRVTYRSPRCHACEAAKQKAYRAQNPHIVKAQEKKRWERHGARRCEQVRIDRLRNPEKYRKSDREDYQLERTERLQKEAERFQRDRDLIKGQKRLRETLVAAQQDWPTGFVVVLIEDRTDFRACAPGALRPRAHEYALGEAFPHPDGYGWRWRRWSVVDARHQVWSEKARRRLLWERRQAMIAAGLTPEQIVAEIGALK